MVPPAYLGPFAVHPHVCGEHLDSAVYNPFQAGSSPRVWGTFCRYLENMTKNRFIPTCVGNILQIP